MIWQEGERQAQERLRRLAEEREQAEVEALRVSMQQLLPNARQCGGCGFGPIDHVGCADLQRHHGESTGRGTISNACPKCGWFAATVDSWPRWDGRTQPR